METGAVCVFFPGCPALLSWPLPWVDIRTWGSRAVDVSKRTVGTSSSRLWTLLLSLFFLLTLLAARFGWADDRDDVDPGVGSFEGLLH